MPRKPSPDRGSATNRSHTRSLRVDLTEEEYRKLKLIRVYSDMTSSDLMRADIERHYREIVVPHLAGDNGGNAGQVNGHTCHESVKKPRGPKASEVPVVLPRISPRGKAHDETLKGGSRHG
jgi:hypothetical protein